MQGIYAPELGTATTNGEFAMISLECFMKGTLAIATNLGIDATPEWQDVIYNNIKNDFTEQEFIRACEKIMREEELYGKMPNTMQFLKYAPSKITSKDVQTQRKTEFLNKVCDYLQLEYASSYDREKLYEGMSELEYRTLQSAGGMADLWRRVHDLDYPTSIAKIRKELSEFFEDNYTSENVTRKIALSNGRAGQTSIGESMAKLLTKYQ